MAVRPATDTDLEALAHILYACYDDDPCYPYRFPWKGRHSDQYMEHCRLKCWEYFTTNTVDVYEVTDPCGWKRVVAFSVWEEPKGLHQQPGRSQTWPRYCVKQDEGIIPHRQLEHQDRPLPDSEPRPTQLVRVPSHPKPFAREDRSREFRDGGKLAKSNIFDKRYTDGYMYLKILLCHPDYRRRGAGTALVRRGMAVAQLYGLNTALFSSPMGLHLYRKLGFQEIGSFEVRVEGEDEALDIPAMLFPAPPRSRRGSRCAAEVVPGGLRKCSTHNVMVAQHV
jgi:GNAT superfamily N-acetyltransferase